MASEAYITRFFYSEKSDGLKNQCLSLFLGPDTFSYAIFAEGFGSVLELCHIQLSGSHSPAYDYQENVSFLIHNHQLHQKKFSKVNIQLQNRDFTLIPQSYASSADSKNILSFVSGHAVFKKPLQHTIGNTVFCYQPEAALLNYLEKTFANASIRHSGSVNMALLFSQHSLKTSDLFLVIGQTNMELLARRDKDLLFYNIFTFESNEDVLYYLLFMMEQFALNPLTTKLSIACERPVEDDLLKNVKKYIRQVTFCVNDPGVNLQGELKTLPAHYYFSLLNQHLCEL
ncbi:MAG: DUF3822 family protein [Bacteroidia bacterium]|nr:DUF3822 family protein [Bacteroidia bacterium]